MICSKRTGEQIPLQLSAVPGLRHFPHFCCFGPVLQHAGFELKQCLWVNSRMPDLIYMYLHIYWLGGEGITALFIHTHDSLRALSTEPN